jgi:hypothetical protein
MFMSRIATAAVLFATTCHMATPAAAQSGLESIPALMRPEYFSRDLLLFIEGLELSDGQQVIVELAFEDYEQDFHAGIEAMNQKITKVAENVDQLRDNEDELLATVLAPIQDWAIEREVLNEQLLENVRVLLDDQQQARWAAFSRRLYREKNLPHGVLAGESINLYHVTRDLELEPWAGTPIEPALIAYAGDLDDALRNRFSQSLLKPGSGFAEVIRRRESGSPEDVARRKGMLRARVGVRDVNDATIELMAKALGGEEGQTFRREALRRGYGRVFRPTPAQRVFKAAFNCQAVKDDVALRTAVQNLYDEYLGYLDEANEGLLEATRQYEPDKLSNAADNSARRVRGENIIRKDDPTRPLYQARREMGAEYIERLKELLGAEAFHDLDGARRFLPRSADTTPGIKPRAPGAGGLGLTSGSKVKGGQKGEKGSKDGPNSLGGNDPRGFNPGRGNNKDRGR